MPRVLRGPLIIVGGRRGCDSEWACLGVELADARDTAAAFPVGLGVVGVDGDVLVAELGLVAELVGDAGEVAVVVVGVRYGLAARLGDLVDREIGVPVEGNPERVVEIAKRAVAVEFVVGAPRR